MARLSIERRDDGMTAVARVVAGPPLTEAEVLAALHGAKVVYGIDTAACALLVEQAADPAFRTDAWVLARAEVPIAGTAGTFEPALVLGTQPGVLRDDGSMDFHDRDLLKPVQAGEVIGRFHAARAGRVGHALDGRELRPAAVREASIVLGVGVARDPDGVVRAARGGVVVHVEGRSLDVVERYDHGSDVDMRSGHLTSAGSLHVKGSVQRTFSVRAAGDVLIERDVESGTVQAGGSVKIRGGVRGGDAGTVYAESDLSAHHAEGAALVSGGVLRLQEASSCELAAQSIRVEGRLRGGTATAEESVFAREAGTGTGLPTTLTAGEPLERPVIGARRAIEVARAERLAAKMVSARVSDASGRLKGGKGARLTAALAAHGAAWRIERLNRRAELAKIAVVEVAGIAHPGVLVCIGEERVLLEAPETAVRFVLDPETHRIHREKLR